MTWFPKRLVTGVNNRISTSQIHREMEDAWEDTLIANQPDEDDDDFDEDEDFDDEDFDDDDFEEDYEDEDDEE